MAGFPNDPESLRGAIAETGIECPAIVERTNQPYVDAASTWECDDPEGVEYYTDTPQIVMMGPITGDEWLKRFPHPTATYSDSWVVIFSHGRQGERESDRFLKLINGR